MTEITKDTWVVLWSPHQRQFHLETFGKMIQTNNEIFHRGSEGDYILLALAKDADEANQICDQYEGSRPKQ